MWRVSSWSWGKWWGLIVWLGSILRVYGLAAAPLWYDEAITAWMAERPFGDMLTATGGDVHPPLWYAICWVTVRLLGTGWWLRVPAVLLAIASLFLLRQVAEAFRLSPAVILASTALMAFLPFDLYYAQEARMYALLQAGALWALLAVLRRRWVQLAIALTVLVYTHNYGAFYGAVLVALALARELRLPVHGVADPPFILTREPDADFRSPLIAAGVAGLLYLPWLGVMLAQAAEQREAWWSTSTTLGGVLNVLYMLWWHLSLQGLAAPAGALLAFTLTFGALGRALATRHPIGLQLAALALAPLAIALAVELVYRPVLLHRAMIGSAAPLYLLVAWAIHEGAPRWRAGLVWAALAPTLALGVLSYHPAMVLNKTGAGMDLWDAIRPRYEAGDLLYHANIGSIVDAHDLPAEIPHALMPVVPGSLGVPNAQVRQALGIEERPLVDLPFRRAWVVWLAGPVIASAEDRAVEAMLAEWPQAELVFTHSTAMGEARIWLIQR